MHKLDALGRRSRLHPQSTGKRIAPTERDLLWFSLLHEHGPLPSSYLLARTADRWRSAKRAKERLTDLLNEAETPHGGPYLTRPLQQFRTIDSRYNQLVYDLAPAGQRALKGANLWRNEASRPSGPWPHAHMVACITASIELSTHKRDDIVYIPGWRILERAQTTLRWPVMFVDPPTKRRITKDLIPDALFGLEYLTPDGPRYRFFVVEADRATEPISATTWNRKSIQRSVRQYEAYVGDEAYKEHLRLTAPLLVLNVCCDGKRKDKTLKATPSGVSYQLFQAVDGFGEVWRPMSPMPQLLEGDWMRIDCGVFRISQTR